MLVVLYDGYITSTQTSLTVIKPDNSELTINSIRLKAPQVIFNQEYNSPMVKITFNESVLYPLSNRVYSRGYSCILSDITYPLLGQNYLTISGFRFIDPAEYFRILDQQGNTAVTELSGNLLLDVTPETPTLYYDSSLNNYIQFDLSGSTLTPVITQTPIIKSYYLDGRENNKPNINFTLNDVSSATIQTIVRDYTYPYIWYLGGVENTKPTLYKIDISGNREEDYTQSSFDYSIINTDVESGNRIYLA